ncbi:MAG: Gfo/Idh/MocA family oxidoreductase [Anaerolineae bacterium]
MQAVYTAAVIGGGVGGKLSLDALTASERFRPLAVADLRLEARAEIEQRYPGVRTYSTYQELFAECPVDVVCVSTYPSSHREVALAALALPLKGILVEKPLGDTTMAGREILDAIRGKGVPVAVPHGLLVTSHSREILKRVHNGEIGRLCLVEIESDKWDIINAGIHWLNFFVALTGGEPMDYVMGMCDTGTRTYRDGMQVETVAVTYAQTVSGVRVVMQTGDYLKLMADGVQALFRLVGTQGSIEFWGWHNAYRLVNSAYPNGRLFEVPRHARSPHQIHLENLAEQIDEGRPDYTVANSSLQALELCEGAYLSHAHRCLVKLPLLDSSLPTPDDWQPGKPYGGQGGGRDGRQLP